MGGSTPRGPREGRTPPPVHRVFWEPDDTVRAGVGRFDHRHFTRREGGHRHRFFELLFLEEGGGVHRFGGREIGVAAGDLYVIAPGEVHDVSGLDEGARGWVVVFEADALGFSETSALVNLPGELLLLSFLRPQGTEAGYFRVSPDDRRFWLDGILALRTELDEKQLGYEDAVRWRLSLLLLEAARLASARLEGVPLKVRPLLYKVFRFVEARYADFISLTDVAREVGLSKSHLGHVVKRETGRTVLEWISERRLTEARRLLLDTDESVETIARSVGFDDPAYFSRVFRRLNGLAPGAWRASNR